MAARHRCLAKNLLFGRRPGKHPQVIATCTPKPNALTIELLKGELAQRGKVVVTGGSSRENAKNLPETYSQTILSPYEGTRLWRQEIEGELLEDVPGALWNCDKLDNCRVERAPEDLMRVVVGIDPAVSATEKSNETGLIVVAQGRDGHGPARISSTLQQNKARPFLVKERWVVTMRSCQGCQE